VSYKDKTMTCADCGQSFVHSAQDQEFFAQKGYTNEPKRCPSCRGARRNSAGGGGFSSGGGYERQMYQATCAECKQSCQVPFEPRQDRPVYCSACYSKQRGSGNSYGSGGSSFGGGRSSGGSSRW
jgi:CxxC-x17-CxxC domain-containing protein